MNDITSLSELRKSIVFLEAEQEVKGQMLRQQFQLTYEGLKPVNLLKTAVLEMSSKPHLTAKLLVTSTGVALGYLTRKIITGATGGIFRNIFGSILQFGVTSLIARHPGEIKSFSLFAKRSLFGRRKANTEDQ